MSSRANPLNMNPAILDLMDRLEAALRDGTPVPTLAEAMTAASQQIEG